MAQFDIYLNDLKPEAQERYLKFIGEWNEDFPVAIVEVYDEE